MPLQVLYMPSFVEKDRIQTTTNSILYRPVTHPFLPHTRAYRFVWTLPCNFNAGRFALTYAKKSCRGCKIIAILDGDELPTSRPVRCTLGEVPGAYWVPKPVWMFWRKAPCSCRDSNPDRPARRMVTVIEPSVWA